MTAPVSTMPVSSRRVVPDDSGSHRASSAGWLMSVARLSSTRHPVAGRRWSCVSTDPDRALRVLVVDDHPIWRDGVARDLETEGFTVCGTSGDGAQALRIAAATRPDVVLLDLQLPDMSGVEVARRLVAAEDPPRILVLSASGERQDVLDAMTAGATGYLVKSASATELVDGVRRVAAGDAVFTAGVPGPGVGGGRPPARRPPGGGAPPPAHPRTPRGGAP